MAVLLNLETKIYNLQEQLLLFLHIEKRPSGLKNNSAIDNFRMCACE